MFYILIHNVNAHWRLKNQLEGDFTLAVDSESRITTFLSHTLFYKSAPPAKQNHTFRACQKYMEFPFRGSPLLSSLGRSSLWLESIGVVTWSCYLPILNLRLPIFFILLISLQQNTSFIEINAFRASFLCSLLGVCEIQKICVLYINSYCKRTLAPLKSARGWFYLGSW